MKKHRLQQLARLAPEEFGAPVSKAPGVKQKPLRLAQRFSAATSDPGYGDKFVRSFLVRGLPLPDAVYEPFFRRAYRHYAGTNATDDLKMVEVEQLTHPEQEFILAVLRALLVCRDAKIPQIVGWLSLDVEVIQIYEQLHFNVRDRADEKAYIASLVFPNGRVELLKTNAVDRLTFGEQLMQAGHTYGAAQVLVLAGIDTGSELPSVVDSLHEFERTLVINAVQLVRSGHLNSVKSPGINHVKQFLKKGRSDGKSPPAVSDDYDSGIGSIGKSAKEWMIEMKRAELEKKPSSELTPEELEFMAPFNPGYAIRSELAKITKHQNFKVKPNTITYEAVMAQKAEQDKEIEARKTKQPDGT